MNKKISDLVATAPVVTAALTDQYECNQGGVSKGGTWQKIVDLIGSLNPLQLTALQSLLGAATWSINADGSAQFGGLVDFDGGLHASAAIQVGANAGISPDGSASFAGGGVAISAAGNLNVGSTVLNADGSASFAGGNATIDAFGAATFAGGAASINGAGEIQSPSYYVGPDQGVTQDVTVLTALPSTFTVLHFSGGILIGTTP